MMRLSAEAVKGAALALERVYDIHSGDSLPASVLSVGHCITDDILKEDLKDTTGLFVDKTRDTLDTSTASETADCRLGDTLDVIAKYLAVALSSALSESFSSFSAA
jgi:hypothetical protein